MVATLRKRYLVTHPYTQRIFLSLADELRWWLKRNDRSRGAKLGQTRKLDKLQTNL